MKQFKLTELIDREIYFPRDFADSLEKDYGILFYNGDNRNSWDSNHAIITDLNTNLETAFQDIILFYREKYITPRIYASMQNEELVILEPYLKKYHFNLAYKNSNQYFLWKKNTNVFFLDHITFQRCKVLTDAMKEIIYSDADGGEWTVKVLEKHLIHPDFHLIAGFVNSIPVTIASLKLMDGYSRVDDVITHTSQRGRGYSRALMNHLVGYHQQISDNFLYLYASNPIAIKNYLLCGFEKINFQFDDWQAEI